MRVSKFTPEQVAMALRQAESGTPVSEICRKLEVTENTFYRWKKKFGGLGTPEIRELRQLREENRKLKSLVADLVSYGYQRLHVLLHREGWRINRKRINRKRIYRLYRLYREEERRLQQREAARQLEQPATCSLPSRRALHPSRESVQKLAELLNRLWGEDHPLLPLAAATPMLVGRLDGRSHLVTRHWMCVTRS